MSQSTFLKCQWAISQAIVGLHMASCSCRKFSTRLWLGWRVSSEKIFRYIFKLRKVVGWLWLRVRCLIPMGWVGCRLCRSLLQIGRSAYLSWYRPTRLGHSTPFICHNRLIWLLHCELLALSCVGQWKLTWDSMMLTPSPLMAVAPSWFKVTFSTWFKVTSLVESTVAALEWEVDWVNYWNQMKLVKEEE